ncbi:MAG: CaiB/BaiF CoA transferase family protein [Acidimicrobiia bacterium]
MASSTVRGPLHGIRIVEFANLGPVPFAGMLMSDLGADVIRIDRDGGRAGVEQVMNRNRSSVKIDLKSPAGVEAALKIVEQADVAYEGYRPGVMERLGLGPEACRARKPSLIYARMTGWGQDGPLAHLAGHDINYLALSGALDQIRRKGERPVPPMNLVADFGGGGAFLVIGILAALLHAKATGEGQVLDVAMTDGVSNLLATIWARKATGEWGTEPGTNTLDTGAPYYEVYDTSDGKFMSVGAIEPQFYARMVKVLGFEPGDLPPQLDRAHWPATKEKFAAVFATKTRDEWTALFDPADCCVAPVLSMEEAAVSAHAVARGTYVVDHGVRQPIPAPRFSGTPTGLHKAPSALGADTDTALAAWGWSDAEIAAARSAGAFG